MPSPNEGRQKLQNAISYVSSYLIHLVIQATFSYTSATIVSTTPLTFLKNLTNKVSVGSF